MLMSDLQKWTIMKHKISATSTVWNTATTGINHVPLCIEFTKPFLTAANLNFVKSRWAM